MRSTIQFIAPALGALFQEFLHYQELSHKLTPKEFQALTRSSTYWLLSLGSVILSAAVVGVALLDRTPAPPNVELLVLGASAPALFKKAVSAAVARKGTLGTASQLSAKQATAQYFLS